MEIPGGVMSIPLLYIATFCGDATDRAAFFAKSVQPILVAKCINCHGPTLAEGGLRLDSRKAAIKGGEHGSALAPGSTEKSLLLQAVHRTRKGMEMPPDEKLSSTEIAAIERWIRDGAEWPAEAVLKETATAPAARIGDAWSDLKNPIRLLFNGERLDLWSAKPRAKTSPPKSLRDSARNPIDAFIPESNLAADRRTLLRRLSFDLLGLPPTFEEVESYVGDESPDANEKVLDRLFASPKYGEHQARMWLDVVRYSDSNGFDWDEYRPQAWRYRDYVIRSFNADKPFDQFIREQLAGDETFAGPPKNTDEQDALIATGYLRLGPQDNSSAGFNEQDRSRAELLFDLVETTGAAFLGATFSCCRCHDHKHDPLSQADYYRFRAFFEGVKYGDDRSIDLAAVQERMRKENQEADGKIKELKAKRDGVTAAIRNRLRQTNIEKLNDDERRLINADVKKLADAEKKRRKPLLQKVEPKDDAVLKLLTDQSRNEVQAIDKLVEALQRSKTKPTTALTMIDGEGAPPPTRVLGGGDYKAPRETVVPGVPSIFDPNPMAIGRCENSKSTGRRTALANWIVARENPLTARVIVNRFWQSLFGSGLVATPDDFGLAGEKPSNPEFLDWLANRFIDEGWSIKRLQRLIVASKAYRSRENPNRRLRRLSAEQLRDALLETSGLMHRKAGGPPSWPELPAEILQANPAFLDDNAEKTKGWYPSAIAEQYCRSIFLVQKRTLRVPFMEAFDQPENAVCCGRRGVSTVAPQALSLMNSPLMEAAAVAFADRIRKRVGDDPFHQVAAAFHLALQRSPAKEELAACRTFLAGRRLEELCRAILNLNEFAYLD
jgi:hypothetical protein